MPRRRKTTHSTRSKARVGPSPSAASVASTSTARHGAPWAAGGPVLKRAAGLGARRCRRRARRAGRWRGRSCSPERGDSVSGRLGLQHRRGCSGAGTSLISGDEAHHVSYMDKAVGQPTRPRRGDAPDRASPSRSTRLFRWQGAVANGPVASLPRQTPRRETTAPLPLDPGRTGTDPRTAHSDRHGLLSGFGRLAAHERLDLWKAEPPGSWLDGPPRPAATVHAPSPPPHRSPRWPHARLSVAHVRCMRAKAL